MDAQTLDAVITPDLVSLEEPPGDKRACIEYLLDLAVDAGRVSDREQVMADLLAREEETTTGVGMGIGIPHAKSAGVDRPTIAFARSSAGLDFDSVDDEPVTLLFLLLVPAEGGDEHLSMLSSLSRALVDEEVRQDLHEATSKREVLDVLEGAVT